MIIKPMLGMFLFFVFISPAQSQFSITADYLCTVNEVYNIADSGKLDSMSSTHAFLIDQQFSVVRATDAMAGKVKHAFFSEVTVIDPGSSEQSFKVVGVSKAQYSYLEYLEIREYVESTNKPFLFRTSIGIRTGTCIHL